MSSLSVVNGRVLANEAQIEETNKRVDDNNAAISSNNEAISTNNKAIATNNLAIQNNADQVGLVKGRVTVNEGDIVQTNRRVDENSAYLEHSLHPVGTIISWFGTVHTGVNLPSGWQLCDGSAINRGPMRGQTTPDLNNAGLFIRGGPDNNAAGTVQEDAVHEHHHVDGGHSHEVCMGEGGIVIIVVFVVVAAVYVVYVVVVKLFKQSLQKIVLFFFTRGFPYSFQETGISTMSSLTVTRSHLQTHVCLSLSRRHHAIAISLACCTMVTTVGKI